MAKRWREVTGYIKDRLQHITCKESKAVRLAVISSLDKLVRRRVLLHKDNAPLVQIMNGLTSRVLGVILELQKLWKILDQHGILIQAQHIALKEGREANHLSRVLDMEDWQLHPKHFRFLDNL